MAKLSSKISSAINKAKKSVSTGFGKKLLDAARSKLPAKQGATSGKQNIVQGIKGAVSNITNAVANAAKTVVAKQTKQPLLPVNKQAIDKLKTDFGKKLSEAAGRVKSKTSSAASNVAKGVSAGVKSVVEEIKKQAPVIGARKAYAVGSEEELQKAIENERVRDEQGFVKRGSGLRGVLESLKDFGSKDTFGKFFGDFTRALNLPERGYSERLGGDVRSIIREIESGNIQPGSKEHKSITDTLLLIEKYPSVFSRLFLREPGDIPPMSMSLEDVKSGFQRIANSGSVNNNTIDYSKYMSEDKQPNVYNEDYYNKQGEQGDTYGGQQKRVGDFVREKIGDPTLGAVVTEMEDHAEKATNELIKDYQEGLLSEQDLIKEQAKIQEDKLRKQYEAIKSRYEYMSEAEKVAAREAMAEIERQLDLLYNEGARTKEEIENIYGEAIRRKLKDARIRANLLRNVFSSLGSANSSAYLESRLAQEGELERDIANAELERNRKMADVDTLLLSERTKAENEKRRIRDNLNNFLSELRRNELLSEEEKNILEREALNQTRALLAETERKYRDAITNAKLNLADYKQKLLASMLPLAVPSTTMGSEAGSLYPSTYQIPQVSQVSGLPVVGSDGKGNYAVGSAPIGNGQYFIWSDGTIRDTFGNIILNPEFTRIMASR